VFLRQFKEPLTLKCQKPVQLFEARKGHPLDMASAAKKTVAHTLQYFYRPGIEVRGLFLNIY
jgi:hypothetical protein